MILVSLRRPAQRPEVRADRGIVSAAEWRRRRIRWALRVIQVVTLLFLLVVGLGDGMPIAPARVEFTRPADRAAEFRGAPGAVRFLELPPRRCVMIDGDGPPGPAAFEPRMPGLYATAYRLRFGLKDRAIVSKVGPLEGLWWTSDGVFDLDWLIEGARDTWRWTLFIALPDEATPDEIDRAIMAGRAKLDPALAPNLRVETFDEGRVAQLLHMGPYATEKASIVRLHSAVEAPGLRLRDRHHEIYLGNPLTSAPEGLRTILRHPVA